MAAVKRRSQLLLQQTNFARHFRSNKGVLSQMKLNLVANEFSDVKSYDEIPTVKRRTLKNIYQYFKLGDGKRYKIQQDITDKYGPIFKKKIGNFGELLFVSHPDDFEKIFTTETLGSKRPFRLWSFERFLEEHNLPNMLLNLGGEEFLKSKNMIKKSLMAPKEVAKKNLLYDDITKDLLEVIEISKDSSSNLAHNLEKYLKKWSFECGGATVFRTRLNILKKNDLIETKEAARKFYESQENLMDYWYELEFKDRKYYQTFPTKVWENFEKGMSQGLESITKLMAEYEEHITDKNLDLSHKEKLTSCYTVLNAAIDATATTALWSMVELSKHPDVQEKICDEVKQNSTGDKIDGKTLQKLRYTRACLKEVFRKNPVTLTNMRELNTDLVLSGYLIPAGTKVVLQTGFVDRLFPVNDSEKFQPERWIKESSCPVGNKPHPFHIVPFGHGTRGCAGRRLAESELYTLYANVFRKYKVSRANDDVIDAENLFLHKPIGPISLRFELR